MKEIGQLVPENYEERHHDRFCQFVRDRSTLKNKHKHQAMGMQFADDDCKHRNVTALSFRKLSTHAPNEVAELAQKARNDFLVWSATMRFHVRFRI